MHLILVSLFSISCSRNPVRFVSSLLPIERVLCRAQNFPLRIPPPFLLYAAPSSQHIYAKRIHRHTPAHAHVNSLVSALRLPVNQFSRTFAPSNERLCRVVVFFSFFFFSKITQSNRNIVFTMNSLRSTGINFR